jgi:hypothetical protein
VLLLNTDPYPDPISLDDTATGGSDLDDTGLEIEFNRRDRTELDETANILSDSDSIATHENQITVYDPTSESWGLVAAWNLEEASGTRADALGRIDLADNNTVTQAAGKVGSAAQFTLANTEYLAASSSDSEIVNFGSHSFTICCWVLFDSAATEQVIAAKWQTLSGQREWNLDYVSGGDRFVFLASADGSTFTTLTASSGGSPGTGTFRFVMAYYDYDADELGISVDDGTVDTTTHSGGIFKGTAPFTLGTSFDGSGNPSLFFDGRIDAVQIFNRVLSSSEVTAIYNSGSGQEVPFTPVEGTLAQSAWADQNSAFYSRADLLTTTSGTIPASVRFLIETREDLAGETFTSAQDLEHECTVSSDLSDDTFLGILDDSIVSMTFTAPDTGSYDFEIGTALSTGAVEASVNGASFASVIAATNTTGTLMGVSAGDTIEVQHTQTGAGTTFTLLLVTPPTSTSGAYGVLRS